MYVVMVVALTVVFPLVSTLIEGFSTGWAEGIVPVAGRWWVFWGIGARLLVAGISQVVRPAFTVENILGQKNEGATHIVQELGFANIGMGVAGLLSLLVAPWAPAVGLVGGLFLGLAGIRHIAKSGKNPKEWLATITDLLVAVIVLAFAVWAMVAFFSGA